MNKFSHLAVCMERNVLASWYYMAAMFIDYFYMVYQQSCLHYMPAVHLIVQMIQTACQFPVKNSCDFCRIGKYTFMCLVHNAAMYGTRRSFSEIHPAL